MSKTARKTTDTVLEVAFLDAPVALHKVTTDGGKAAKWETRLVDEKGKVVNADDPAPVPLSLGGAAEQGDPLGLGLEEARAATSRGSDLPLEGLPTMTDVKEETVEVTRQRGFETERYGFVPADAQLEAIDEYAALEVMRVGGFVRAEQVHRNRIIGSYYLVPADDTSGARARHLMEVLKAGLQRTSRMAVVKWTKKKGQSLGVIAPDRSGGLVLLELAWGENVRSIPKTGILNGDLATQEEVDACVDLIEAMREPRASLDEMRDDAVVLRRELRALAEEGRVDEFVPPKTEEEEREVASLVDELAGAAKVAEDYVATA